MRYFPILSISPLLPRWRVLGWNKLLGEERTQLEEFVSNANTLFITSEIEQATIMIKRTHNIALPDAIIGATALVNNLILLTRNERDFTKIKGLEIGSVKN